MPFNRVDYYLDKRTGDFPSSCAQSTYTLYRSTISQSGGTLSYTPLIDCVRDFQVAFGLYNSSAAGTSPIQWQGNLLQPNWMPNPNTQMNSSQIQQYLREVRVFVLYQEGLGDTGSKPDFRFSTAPLTLGDPDTGTLSTWTPSGQDLQYRWKVLEIDIKPMNLNLNH